MQAIVLHIQVFAEFDTDGSGSLDYEEFSKMLPEMGIYLPPSKVVRAVSRPRISPAFVSSVG